MDDKAFDDLIASLDAPTAIITAAVNGNRAGCLIGFHGQSSIEPRRYAVWLSKANHTLRVALLSRHLGVHFLTADDRDLAEIFGTQSGDDVDKFARCDWESSTGDVPVLRRCANRLVLHRTGLLDEGGDHLCFIGEPLMVATSGAFTPLRLSAVSDLDAGHPVDD